jgi:hypothetical protein
MERVFGERAFEGSSLGIHVLRVRRKDTRERREKEEVK